MISKSIEWEVNAYLKCSPLFVFTGPLTSGQRIFRLSRKLVGISIKVGYTEKKELLVGNTSEICTEEFDLRIE